MTTLDKLVTEGETAKLALHLLWWLPLVVDCDSLHLVGTARHSHVQILAQPVKKIFKLPGSLKYRSINLHNYKIMHCHSVMYSGD